MDKKEMLRDAAERLFREKGFQRTSVRDIGEAAGLGPSAVSYYFGNKGALYHDIFPEGTAARADDVSLRIEKSAVQLFAAEGYEKVSIRDIAHAAGVGSAAISYYFGGKAELYKEVLYKGTGMISEFIQMVEDKKPDPAGIIHLYGTFLCRLGREKPEVLRLIFWELMNGTDVFNEFVRERLRDVLDIVRQAVEDGIAAGDFRSDLSPEEVCISWAGMVLFFFLSGGLHEELAPERDLEADTYLEQTWGILMSGIRNRRMEDGR